MNKKRNRNDLILFFIYCIFNFIIFMTELDFLYPVLVWNVFLAMLPLFFIKRVEIDRFNYLDIIYILLWLFFFPNAIYMITDFIHIAGLEYTYMLGDSIYNRELVYSRDFIIWARLLLIGGGFFFSTVLGLESFYIFYSKLKVKLGNFKSKILLVIVSLLAGVGVYIGRFLRFNSWDIVGNPLNILRELFSSLDLFSFYFILAFGIFTLFLMGIYTNMVVKRER